MLVLINTPGGSLPATRKIVEAILASKVPVLCLVHPSGGHAGSAGAIIMQACHASGVMPATNIGAATPILATGQEISKDLRKKLINDTTSWMQGLTNLRGRSEKFGQEIITEAKAVSGEEAVKIKAVDFLVPGIAEFLDKCQGKVVKMSEDKTQTVQVGPIVEFNEDLRLKVLSLVADPETAYMMFMGSIGLLYFELTHPGMIVPGVVGGIGLVVSLIALQKLDVAWGGLLLLLLGLAFFIGEVFVPSFGALGVGGIVCFVMGSLFLFDSKSGYHLPIEIIIATTVLIGGAVFGIAYLAWTTRSLKKQSGGDQDVSGELARVTVIKKEGTSGCVQFRGEIWRFSSEKPVSTGQTVEVLEMKKLTLKVKPKEEK